VVLPTRHHRSVHTSLTVSTSLAVHRTIKEASAALHRCIPGGGVSVENIGLLRCGEGHSRINLRIFQNISKTHTSIPVAYLSIISPTLLHHINFGVSSTLTKTNFQSRSQSKRIVFGHTYCQCKTWSYVEKIYCQESFNSV